MRNPNIQSFFDELEKIASTKGILIGAGVYGGAMAIGHALTKTDFRTGKKYTKKQRMRNALIAGILGAGVGGIAGHALSNPSSGSKTLIKLKSSPKPVVTNRNLTYRPDYLKPLQGGKTGKPGKSKAELTEIKGGKNPSGKPDWILPDKE